jgi:O-antigen/teichoic acid export membrane protein
MAFGFLVGVQLARGLGAEGYGVYGLAMSVIVLLTVPTEFGLPQLLTREVAAAHAQGNWAKIRSILRWATRASLMISLIVGLALLAWLVWRDQLISPLGKTVIAGIGLVPLVALLSLRSAALRGAQQIVMGQLPEVALRPAFHSLLLFTVPALLFPLTPELAMWLGVFAAGGALVLADRLMHRALPAQVFSVQVGAIDSREWWASAVPMAMTEGMRLLQANALIFLLGGMVAMSEVGIFRMAVSTVALVSMPLSLFTIVSMPVVARLHTIGQRAQLQRMLTWVSAGMLAGVALLSLPFLLAGEWLLGFVFGPEFAIGNEALLILCLGIVVNAVFGLNAALLNMTGHQDRVMVDSGIALAVLVLSAPPLIIGFGIVGAAISNLLSVITWNIWMWRDCRRMLDLETGIWAPLSIRS